VSNIRCLVAVVTPRRDLETSAKGLTDAYIWSSSIYDLHGI
jgi:hypothetical protein